jgi:hypothetical protein
MVEGTSAEVDDTGVSVSSVPEVVVVGSSTRTPPGVDVDTDVSVSSVLEVVVGRAVSDAELSEVVDAEKSLLLLVVSG